MTEFNSPLENVNNAFLSLSIDLLADSGLVKEIERKSVKTKSISHQ